LHAGYYVTAGGSNANNGSSTSPWSLSYALSGAGGVIHPGDTVWLRGGTYNTGQLVSTITGTVLAPIIVRQYPGERATINTSPGDWTVQGSDVWFQGFEVAQSAAGGYGISVSAPRSKFINLVIHDAQYSGMGNWIAAVGSEVTGCLIYNNGTRNNQDHGIYIQNNVATTKLFQDNIVFNNWAVGLHTYAQASSGETGWIRNVTYDGNVLFGTSLIGGALAYDLLVGGSVAAGPVVVVNRNYVYRTDGNLGVELGYSSSNTDLTYTNNYIGRATTHVGSWSPLLQSGNSINTAGTSPDLTVVRPNPYEAGRGNIVIYNWTGAANVSVDLSSILAVGQSYKILNAQDFFGTPVVSGTYSGGTVSIPMAGIPAPTPVGRGRAGPTTGPTFQVFVVRLAGA
jgi:hypothetical protein